MTDVIVIGAGLSGLVCARRLVDAGLSTLVIEARDRVGGRTLTGELAGRPIDLGGQWMSPDQPRLAALADELDVATEPQYRDGSPIVARPEEDRMAIFLLGSLITAAERALTLRAINRLSRRCSIADLADGPAALDEITLGDWLDRRLFRWTTRELIEMAAALKLAAAPEELSMLWFVASLGACGGLTDGAAFSTGERDRRFTGGAQQLSLRLADDLGDRVRLACPVRAIEQDGETVTVRHAGGVDRARRCVLAVPPAQCAAIEVAGRSAPRAAVEAGMPHGPVVKCALAYERPFWREAGRSGESYQIGGAVRATVDACDGDRAALLAFVVAGDARGWSERAESDRRRQVTDELAQLFGPEAASPIGYVDYDWAADPWSAGCVGNLGVGLARHAAALREPCGRVHYAGSETALRWPRYLEGAVDAGERAAAEVAAALASG